jgi:hypothetical protein
MIDFLLSASPGSDVAAVTRKLKAAFQDGAAIELVAGLAYLRMLAAEHADLPDEAHVERLRGASDPAVASEAAVAALEHAEAFRHHGALLRALGLAGKVETFVREANGTPIDFQGLLDGTAFNEHSEGVLAAVEGALNTLMTGPGRFRAGEYHTPPRVVDLMVQLLAPTAGSRIYDPTCGTGSLLLGAFDATVGAGGPPPELFAQDINPTAVALTRVRAHLRGARAEIALGDVLQVPAHVANGGIDRFDYVISNLPRGVRLDGWDPVSEDPYGRFSPLDGHGSGGGDRRAGDAVFLLHAAASLGETGRAVVTVSPSLLSAGGAAQWAREALVAQDLVEAVITLPRALYGPATLTAPPLLVLNRSKAPEVRGKVLFVEGETSADGAAEVAARAAAVVWSLASAGGFSCLADGADVAANDYSLLPASYVTLVEMERFMGGKGLRLPLSEIAEVLAGHPAKFTEGGAEPVVKAVDLRDRAVDLDELDRVSVEGDRNRLVVCRPGDVLLQGVARRPAAVEALQELAGAIVDRSIVVLRPREGWLHLSGYLEEFLNSDLGQSLLSSRMSSLRGDIAVRPAELRRLQVPVPAAPVIQFISEVRGVERELRDRRLRAQGLRDRLFKLDDPERFDEELRRLKTESEVLARSVVQTDSLGYRVRNLYPFPIAYRYRELEGIGTTADLHKALLCVAEAALAYLGSVGLALAAHVGAHAADPGLANRIDLQEKYWRSGMTLGNWRELAYRSAGAIRKRAAEHPVPAVAADFAAMWFEGRGKKASALYKGTTQRLVELRNDAHHDRGPTTPSEYERENEELRGLLDDFYEALGWTISYPLRLVTRVSEDWGSDAYVAETKLYTGDHPGLRQERVRVRRTMPERHLYLETSEERWASLYPLITVQHCPSCKRPETYSVDRWEGAGQRTVLKSFERGHALNSNKREGADTGASSEAQAVSLHLATWFDRLAPPHPVRRPLQWPG